MDITSTALEHCESMASTYPDLAADYETFGRFYQEKLWHQLTQAVLEFVQDPSKARTGRTHNYLELYDKVILQIDKHLNPLSLAQIAAAVAQALALSDRVAAKAVLENLMELTKEPLASSYLQSQHAMLQLEPFLEANNDANKTEILQQIKILLPKQAAQLKETSNRMVHAAHYQTAMMYSKIVGPPEDFYAAAIQFLNYTNEPQSPQLAVDLCLAALTGENVYNLGQVEQTPILSLLANTPNEWLVQLLQATAAGDVVGFGQLTKKYKAEIAAQPALVHRATAVQEKLTLLALVHLVLDKDASDRTLTFEEMATRLHIDMDQVEWVVMRALSVQLVKGTIDQVQKTVHIDWVMPRILNAAQMADLANRFGEWAAKVKSTKVSLQEPTSTFA